MQELEYHIKRINDKLQQLLKKHVQLQKDNERQTKLIASLQEKASADTATINTLQQQINILKTATNNLTETDKKNFEKHITQYIKEIDKCIGLLSE